VDVLSFRPRTGLFRLVMDGKQGDWYYRLVSEDWTTNPNEASLMPRSIADSIKAKYPEDSVRVVFVPQVSGVKRWSY
jgi:uncharacterized cysteine cluster protein YcgN (CxxCxxCC family)